MNKFSQGGKLRWIQIVSGPELIRALENLVMTQWILLDPPIPKENETDQRNIGEQADN
jgi:hypothetical protein